MGWDRSHSIEATRLILEQWQAEGYEFVSIPEFIERTGFQANGHAPQPEAEPAEAPAEPETADAAGEGPREAPALARVPVDRDGLEHLRADAGVSGAARATT